MTRKMRARSLERPPTTKTEAIGQTTRRNVRWVRPPRQEIAPEAIAAPDLARQIRKWQAWLQEERRYSRRTLCALASDVAQLARDQRAIAISWVRNLPPPLLLCGCAASPGTWFRGAGSLSSHSQGKLQACR